MGSIVYMVVTRGASAMRRRACLVFVDFHPCIAGVISCDCAILDIAQNLYVSVGKKWYDGSDRSVAGLA